MKDQICNCIEFHTGPCIRIVVDGKWYIHKEEVERLRQKDREELIMKIEELPLCYSDEQASDDEEAGYISGQAHMKGHILDIIKQYENNK